MTECAIQRAMNELLDEIAREECDPHLSVLSPTQKINNSTKTEPTSDSVCFLTHISLFFTEADGIIMLDWSAENNSGCHQFGSCSQEKIRGSSEIILSHIILYYTVNIVCLY